MALPCSTTLGCVCSLGLGSPGHRRAGVPRLYAVRTPGTSGPSLPCQRSGQKLAQARPLHLTPVVNSPDFMPWPLSELDLQGRSRGQGWGHWPRPPWDLCFSGA